MAVFRVEKTRNYTVMSNYHLRDKSLSLKAKGLLLIWTAPRPVRTPICGGTAWRTTRTVCGRGWRDSTIHSEIWRFVS